MDKLRRALSGNDGDDEERGFVAQVRSFFCKKNVVGEYNLLLIVLLYIERNDLLLIECLSFHRLSNRPP